MSIFPRVSFSSDGAGLRDLLLRRARWPTLAHFLQRHQIVCSRSRPALSGSTQDNESRESTNPAPTRSLAVNEQSPFAQIASVLRLLVEPRLAAYLRKDPTDDSRRVFAEWFGREFQRAIEDTAGPVDAAGSFSKCVLAAWRLGLLDGVALREFCRGRSSSMPALFVLPLFLLP